MPERATRRKRRPSRIVTLIILFLQRVSCVPGGILDVTRGLVRGTLRLVYLALVLKFLITTELTRAFFYGALGLVSSPLHVLAIHSLSPFGVLPVGRTCEPADRFYKTRL